MGAAAAEPGLPAKSTDDSNDEQKRTKTADEKKAPEGAFSGLLPSGFGR
ncbi:hypothetical protein HHL24_21285 [Paraburkholderia sp. RP-4-7]|uniref:Uncharacterized protein n=1 Tax=Paraburkholderia polaris TaxID=2728848 RepID=A0A848IJU2_9BURK|nr:hypothetical protein [Paraburkholderia polaris]NMM00459.1 hypothetical protein [Paraburkholderia polaris]